MDLTEFLRARLADRVEAAEAIHALGCGSVRYDGNCDCGEPEHVLAEVEAKRRIVDEHAANRHDECKTCGGSDSCGCMGGVDHPCDTLRLLALPYADHPDYLPEWKP